MVNQVSWYTPWKVIITAAVKLKEEFFGQQFGQNPLYTNTRASHLNLILSITWLSYDYSVRWLIGAGGGTRTPTGIRPSDFKSGMSTIPSRPHTGSTNVIGKAGHALKMQKQKYQNNLKKSKVTHTKST